MAGNPLAFLIGLGLLMIVAVGTVIGYPAVLKLMPLTSAIDTSGPMGRLISEALDVQKEYRGFIWWQWFRQNLTQIWTLFASLLGSGGLLSKATGGGELFTLSLPTSRNRVFAVRTSTAFAELFVLAFVPSLLIPLFSPAIGQSYRVGDVMVHGACLFVGGSVFFSLAMLLSTVFNDLWRPLLIACAVAVVLALSEQFVRNVSEYGTFRAMAAELYFRRGGLPWPELFVSAAASAAMLYGAVVNLARRDF